MIVQFNHPPENPAYTGTNRLIYGQRYHVLGIEFNFHLKECNLTVLNNEYPISIDNKYFDVIFDVIPGDWVYYNYENIYSLDPKAFDEHFWDDFHDGESYAEKIFVEEYKKIVAFHAEAGFLLPDNDKALDVLIDSFD